MARSIFDVDAERGWTPEGSSYVPPQGSRYEGSPAQRMETERRRRFGRRGPFRSPFGQGVPESAPVRPPSGREQGNGEAVFGSQASGKPWIYQFNLAGNATDSGWGTPAFRISSAR